jgi:hypothetical protein
MSHKSSGILGQIAMWGIAGLGAVFFIMIMSGNESGIDGGLYLTYAAFGIGVLLAVLSGVMSLFTGGSIKSTLIPVGAFLAVFIITYILADGTVKPAWAISGTASKLISAGLTMTGIAILVAVAAAIYGWVKKLIS